jgi:hypothetical protein
MFLIQTTYQVLTLEIIYIANLKTILFLILALEQPIDFKHFN